jgi:hypothetical protein
VSLRGSNAKRDAGFVRAWHHRRCARSRVRDRRQRRSAIA